MAGPGNTVIDGAPGQAAPRTGAFPPDRAIAGRWRLAAHRRCLWLAAALLVLAAPVVQAAVREEACNRPLPADTGPTATAIVRTACLEHKAWFQPFIDGNGRLASLEVTEAERARLADDTPAWQRVARYWRESGTLSSMLHIAGAHSCLFPGGGREADNDCRAYLVDNPWSAAFVSWVMARAPVPGFRGSPRHADYIARAWNDPEGSPYAFADPYTNRAVPGDLLCHLRDHEVLGPEGLRQALDSPWRRMPQRSHCDIVVAADGDDGNDPRMLYVVGGNVLNAVTMRMLPLDADGRPGPARRRPGRPAAGSKTTRQIAQEGPGGPARAATTGGQQEPPGHRDRGRHAGTRRRRGSGVVVCGGSDRDRHDARRRPGGGTPRQLRARRSGRLQLQPPRLGGAAQAQAAGPARHSLRGAPRDGAGGCGRGHYAGPGTGFEPEPEPEPGPAVVVTPRTPGVQHPPARFR